MACFVVTTVAAATVSTIRGIKKINNLKKGIKYEDDKADKKLRLLDAMLWGGSFLLCIEHIWHGEVVPWFPFLTAMNNQEDMVNMFKEMGTVGVAMTLGVVGIWGIIMLAQYIISRAKQKKVAKE